MQANARWMARFVLCVVVLATAFQIFGGSAANPLSATLPPMIETGMGEGDSPDFGFAWTLLLLAACLFVVLRSRALDRRLNRLRQLTPIAPVQTDANRPIGDTIDALRFGNRHTRPETRKTLARLLPRMTPDEAAALTDLHRDTLTRELAAANPRRQAEYVLALLAGLAASGDYRSLETVGYLVDSGGEPLEANGVREAARRCVAAIRERETRRRAGATLLRASGSDTPEGLLRAAAGGGNTDTGQLPRPAHLSGEEM